MRAGRGLGVELERLEAVAAQALDGAVVERDVADLGASPGATAKPWFCAVTRTRFEPVTRTGWLAPR